VLIVDIMAFPWNAKYEYMHTNNWCNCVSVLVKAGSINDVISATNVRMHFQCIPSFVGYVCMCRCRHCTAPYGGGVIVRTRTWPLTYSCDSFTVRHSVMLGERGSLVVEALYKTEGRGFKTRWGEWFFFLIYLILPAALGPGGSLSLWQKWVLEEER
jgi:hypothetical protein